MSQTCHFEHELLYDVLPRNNAFSKRLLKYEGCFDQKYNALEKLCSLRVYMVLLKGGGELLPSCRMSCEPLLCSL